MTDALIGKQLNNFRIERLLGRGGMAKVYYGTDIGLNRPVAIKVIDDRWRDDEQFTARFISEAQTIAKWRHDNIIQVYYAGNDDDLYYFVMEYIEGQDLTKYIHNFHEDETHIPYDKTISILNAIASGLDYAHGKGVVHRDVKPSNIMMGNDGRVVLMDFGLALNIQKGTIGESFGTPHYIAPEQAKDPASAVAQSDQYALGVIAYEMFAGQVPFDNPSAMTVALMHISDEPPKPSSINPSLTPDIENVLLKVLNKDPNNRFPSCQSFIETLEHTIAGRPTLIDDVSPTEMGEILITPPAKSNTETRINRDKKAQPQSSEGGNRIPLTLIAVVVIAIVVVGLFAVLGGGNDTTADDTTPTQNAQIADVATDTQIPTDIPATDTNEPTSEPTNTSVPPTNTPIPPTETSQPTQTPVPTDTSIPPTATNEPTSEPTNTTIPPSNTPIPPTEVPTQAVLEPTLAFPDGSPIVLYYNDNSFYVWNTSSRRIRSGNFKFEALNENGNIVSTSFDGFRWTQFYSFIDSGGCASIEMTVGRLLQPDECGVYNAVVNTTPSGDINFWIADETITGFRVLWQDEEIARCNSSDGECRLNIP